MTDSDQSYLDRMTARLSASSQDTDFSEGPELMLAIHTSDGCVYLLPYHALQAAELRPEDRLAENVQAAEVTLEFSNAVVKFQGEDLEDVLGLVQRHQLRRVREANTRAVTQALNISNVRLAPRRAKS